MIESLGCREHYSCMVDLLGRAELLKEVTDIVGNMPIETNEYVWVLFETRRMYRQEGHCRRSSITISNPEVKEQHGASCCRWKIG